jgi:glycosyltransferase involved in cell wall biosynthesis
MLDPVTGGGTAERTIQMSRALRDAGTDCSILTTNAGLSADSELGLAGVHVIAFRCLVQRYFIPLARYKTIKKVVASADVVHLMGHWTALNALVYLAAMAKKKPYVVCPAGALRVYGRSKMLKRFYNWLVGRRIIRNASAWIAITNDECAQFEAYGVRRDLVTIIPNGVNPADFPRDGVAGFREKHGLGGRPFILFIGRLNTIKGPDLLLEAFCRDQQRWPDWHLVFAGPDGGLLASLKDYVASRTARDRVHFIGYVGGAEKSAAYQAADLLVIPSRHEAMSIVVLESGITGTPALLTDQCGFDVIEKIGGGKVVPATVAGIHAGLVEMLSDRAKLAVMGNSLRDYVRDNYTWVVIVRMYLDLYRKLFAESRCA